MAVEEVAKAMSREREVWLVGSQNIRSVRRLRMIIVGMIRT